MSMLKMILLQMALEQLPILFVEKGLGIPLLKLYDGLDVAIQKVVHKMCTFLVSVLKAFRLQCELLNDDGQ